MGHLGSLHMQSAAENQLADVATLLKEHLYNTIHIMSLKCHYSFSLNYYIDTLHALHIALHGSSKTRNHAVIVTTVLYSQFGYMVSDL